MADLFPEPSDETGIWRVGTAGWSYPLNTGPGTWTGLFYPLTRTDELKYYARFFNVVEVNSTFYRPCDAKVAAGWVRRTPSDFEFSVKVWREFTHGRGPWTAADLVGFKEGIEPIREAGKLGCLLFQFPASFVRTQENLDYLRRLLDGFGDYVRVVELRHRSWAEPGEIVAMSAIPAFIDEPKFDTSIRQELPSAGAFLYVRFHGRRADAWWKHRTREERYDYLYDGSELEGYSRRLRQVSRQGPIEKAYLIFNNHPGGKAVANAVMLRKQLDVPVRTPLPDAFLARYPELRAAS